MTRIRNELWIQENFCAYPNKKLIKELRKRIYKIDSIKAHHKYKPSLITYGYKINMRQGNND